MLTEQYFNAARNLLAEAEQQPESTKMALQRLSAAYMRRAVEGLAPNNDNATIKPI